MRMSTIALVSLSACSSVSVDAPRDADCDAAPEIDAGPCVARQDNDAEICAANHCAVPVYCDVAIYCDTACDTAPQPASCGYPTDLPACMPCDLRPDLAALCPPSLPSAVACAFTLPKAPCESVGIMSAGKHVACCP